LAIGINLNRVLVNCFKALLGFLNASTVFLLISDFLGNLFSALFYLIKGQKKIFPIQKINYSTVKKYSHFPTYNLPTTILNISLNELPIIILGLLYNPKLLGYYVVAHKLFIQPAQLIGNSIGVVISRKMAIKHLDGHELFNSLIRLVVVATGISIIPVLVATFWGETLFSLFLGESWSFTGKLVEVVAILFWCRIVQAVIFTIFISIENLKNNFRFKVFEIILLLLALYIAGEVSLYRSVVSITISQVFSTFTYIILAIKTLKERDKNYAN
jgi:O-antigen/teichoic acid export membrane protein